MNFNKISYISLLFILISCDSFKTVNLYDSVINKPDPYQSFNYKDMFQNQNTYQCILGSAFGAAAGEGRFAPPPQEGGIICLLTC